MTATVFKVEHIRSEDCVNGWELKPHSLYVLVRIVSSYPDPYGWRSSSAAIGEIVHRCGLDLASLTGRLFTDFTASHRTVGLDPQDMLFYELPTELWHKLFESLLAPLATPAPHTVSKEYLRSLEFD